MGKMPSEKKKEYNQKHYQENKSKYLEKSRRHKIKIADYVRQLKESTPCKDCKQSYPYWIMQFDHLRDKHFTLASAFTRTGYKKTIEEIEKCDILCANCHADRTYKRRKTHE